MLFDFSSLLTHWFGFQMNSQIILVEKAEEGELLLSS